MMRAHRHIAVLLFVLAGAAAAADDPGKPLYDKYCAQCHGAAGDGRGYATARLKPEPRDFTAGKYKFRTTPSGRLPTDDDLRRVIRNGLPYTSMPAWPGFTDDEVQSVIDYLKTFSTDFQNEEKKAPPIDIPQPPAVTDASVAKGREVYQAQGCAACHGNLGRGDGTSAPTLTDDWGKYTRPADLSQRWTFRGGPTRTDVFRTFSTGLNGTPMPSYFDSLAVADRWDLVSYIESLGEGDAPGYSNLLLVEQVEDELAAEQTDTLFSNAPSARFPLIGQIIEPGRNFHPPTTSVRVEALYNAKEIAIRVRWNDMRAETAGHNSPLLEVPDPPADAAAEAEEEDADDDIWGEEAAAPEEDEGGFWDEEEAAAPQAAGGEFSDAVALQFPTALPAGIRKPYFLFGDAEQPVDLWFVDLARGGAEQFVGRGSASLTPQETDEIEVTKSYVDGEWTVVFKRSLRSTSNLTFEAGQYVPIAFSVWDGFSEERGNKRALSVWFYLYLKPAEEVSAVGPMAKAALGTLAVELLIVLGLRRRYRGPAPAAAQHDGVRA